jgi:hypothetical protein
MIFEVPDTFGITWCTSSLTTAWKGTSTFRLISEGGPIFRSFGPIATLQAVYLGRTEHLLGRTERISQPSGSRGGLTMPCFFLEHCSSFLRVNAKPPFPANKVNDSDLA